jgi:hypothetical protein
MTNSKYKLASRKTNNMLRDELHRVQTVEEDKEISCRSTNNPDSTI